MYTKKRRLNGINLLKKKPDKLIKPVPNKDLTFKIKLDTCLFT